jgi:aryl-alcohol dehydrogenase-like predicted oxidoreductase
MTVCSPLAYGFLAGAYTREDLARPDNRFAGFDMLRFDRDQGFALLDVMRGIAQRSGASVAQVALAWLLERPGVDSVLIGATRLDQLEQNLGAADVVLGVEDRAALDAATAITPIYPSSDWIVPDRRVVKALGRS